MVDHKLDGGFDMRKGDDGGYQEVDGLEEFEQTLAVVLHFQFSSLAGRQSRTSTIKEKISSVVYRVARATDSIDSVRDVQVFRKEEQPNTLQVEVRYLTGERFIEEI